MNKKAFTPSQSTFGYLSNVLFSQLPVSEPKNLPNSRKTAITFIDLLGQIGLGCRNFPELNVLSQYSLIWKHQQFL